MRLCFCYPSTVLVAIRTPADNERGPRYMEKVFAAIHQAGATGESIHLEYGHRAGEVGLFMRFPQELRRLVLEPLAAKYPGCRFAEVRRERQRVPCRTWYAHLRLTPELYPILRHSQFEDLLTRSFEDPIDGILKAVQPEEGIEGCVRIAIRRARPLRRWFAKRAVKRLDCPFFRRHFELGAFYARRVMRPWAPLLAWPLGLLARGGDARWGRTDVSGGRQHEREDDVQAASDKIGGHLFEASISIALQADDAKLARDRLRAIAGAFGSLTRSRLATFRISRIRRGRCRLSHGRGFLLSAEELATMFHPPTAGVQMERLASTAFKELEPPVIVYALVIVVCLVVGFVWWLLVNQPIGIGKAWLHWFGRRLADLWKAHSTAWAWLRRRWRGIWVPKPKTREQILSEAVDDAKRDYKSRLQLIDNAEMDEVESRVARRFARRKLLQRLHRIID